MPLECEEIMGSAHTLEPVGTSMPKRESPVVGDVITHG